jgi:hypothetical protein
MTDRKARVFGRLLLTTTPQVSSLAPLIDGATVRDAEGRRYGAFVFGRGQHALVVGWRDARSPSWALLHPIRARRRRRTRKPTVGGVHVVVAADATAEAIGQQVVRDLHGHCGPR